MKLSLDRYVAYGLSLALATFVACGGDNSTGPDDGGQGGSTNTSTGTDAGNGGSTGSGTPTFGDVVINEIMYDPSASPDATGEWVELYNPTSSPVNLEGWVLRDHAENLHVIDALVLEPGGYVVLGRSTADNGGAPVDQAYGDTFKLSNGADAVVLENPEGEIVDEVQYDTVSPWPAATFGVSIELTAPDLDNALPGNWKHAVVPFGDGDLGTPGRANGGTVQVPGFVVDDGVASWHQPALETSVLFAPEDDLEAHVLAQLETAQSSIKLAFFNIRLDDVKNLLAQKMNAGVDVKVILDKKQQDKSYNTMGDDLAGLGVDVTLVENTNATNATMHNKFAVIDGHVVMAGSANYSYTALNVSDEDLITFDDAGLAARYTAEFAELLAGGDVDSPPYSGSPAIRAWMGPEDSLHYKVVDAIDAAQTQVTVAMFQLNTDMIVDALVDAHQRGVKVVVVLDEVQATQVDETADETLAAAGIDVVLADATGNSVAEMHSKFVVVDHQTVLMGSYNWTNLGSFYNDENVLVIDDAHLAARVEGKFASMLGTYNVSASTLGLTTGTQQVTFTVGNVTMDPGLELVVKGNGPLAQGIVLDNGSATVSVDAGTRLDYHYEVRDSGSTVATEVGAHAFTVPYAPGPFDVADAYLP
jgi:phosphatidylserine/phosphatidylglycerophosphate/cardiolipin synthase-like enzyme